MAFFESVKSAFINCLNFKGRTNRKDFWNYVIFFAIMLLILYFPALKIAKELRHGSYFFISPLLLAMPLFSLICRRFNDAGKTRWQWIVLAFLCFYSLLVLIVMIFHHPDLEFARTVVIDEMSEWSTNPDEAPGEEDPYLIAFLLPFTIILSPLILVGAILYNLSSGILLAILLILFFALCPLIIYALSRQKNDEDEDIVEKDEDAAKKEEDTTEEEGPAEEDKKLGTAGKVFLFVVAALVIGIPVIEIIRLTSAA